MKQSKVWNQFGQSLIELLIAVTIFGLFALAIAGLTYEGLVGSEQTDERTRAIFLAHEGIDATRSIRDLGYKSLVNGNHGLDDGLGYWQLSGTSETIDTIFTRTLTISDVQRDGSGDIVLSGGTVDPRTKLVRSEVSYTPDFGPANIVYVESYLSDWAVYDWFETSDSEFSLGTTSDTEVVGTGIASDVQLLEGTGGTGGGGPSEWIEGGGASYVDTTDTNFNAGTLTDIQVVDTSFDAKILLGTEPKWDVFDFPFGTTDMNYASQYFAVGNNGNAYRWQANRWAEIDTPTTLDLHHVTDVSPTEAYAVGENGYAMRYAGGVWTTVSTPTGEDLNGVDMVSTDDGWAVGDNATMLRWNGSEWTSVSVPTSRDLQSVDVIDADDVWAVGFQGTILHWNGTSWSSVTSPTNKELYAVDMLSASDGFAVGNNGEIIRYNGSSWSLFTTPTTRRLQDISMISASDGFIVGDSGEIVRWNGTSWSVVLSPANDDLMSVYMISASDGWVVGDNGNVYRWNGSEWGYYTQTDPDDFRGIEFFSTSLGFMTGDNGELRKFDGNTWADDDSGVGEDLNDVSFISATDAFAVGQSGRIIRWNGTSWSTVSSPTGQELNAVYMISATDGFAVANNGVIIQWNGSTWSTISSPTGQDLEDIDMLSSTDGFIAADNGVILRWNGSVWNTQSTATGQHLYGISMASASFGFATGTGGTIQQWNGSTWASATSPTGSRLRKVKLSSATSGYAVGDGGVIVNWNGTSWSTVTSPTGETLYAIGLLSESVGWAAGNNGAILELAQFYKTSGTFESRIFDGGTAAANWDLIQWTEFNFTVTDITIQTRTGETATPDGSWSGWSSTLTNPNGEPIGSPAGRYIQYRANLTTSNVVISPEILDVVLILDDPGLSQQLNGVKMLSETSGWAVGNNGTIIDFDGTAWDTVTSPSGVDLNGVDFLSASDGWAVGDSGVILQYNGSWSTVTSGTSTQLNAVYMVASNDVWAVGNGGEIHRWNGATWSSVASPSSQVLQDIWMVSASEGWIVGNSGTILSWNGSTWSTVASPVGQSLNAVEFIASNDGWAAGDSGKILRYNGSWSEFADSGSTVFEDISLVATDEGKMVGSGGKILSWDTVSWVLDLSPTSQDLRAVDIVTISEGWSMGENGTILHLTPVGTTGGGGTPTAAQFIDDTQPEFDTGTYSSTQWDTDHVELTASSTTGTYASEVFDGTDNGVSWDQISWAEDISQVGLKMEAGSVVAPGGSGGGSGSIVEDTQVEFDAGTYGDTQWSTDHIELNATGLTNGTGTYTSQIFNQGGASTSYDTLSWVPDGPYGKELPDSIAGSSGWWNTSYSHRRKITFGTAHSTLPEYYTISYTMDTQTGSTNVALTSGDDVRIVWDPVVGADVELDRIGTTWNNAATVIVFRLQSEVGANLDEDVDGSYYVYYGNAGAGSPPIDETNVFYFADFFNRADSTTIGNGWTEWNTGGGDADIVSNTLSLIGDNTGPADAGIKQNFPLGAISGDFSINFDWTMPSNTEGLWTFYLNVGNAMSDASRTSGVGPGIYNGEGSWFSPNGTENISNDLSGNMENNINGGPYTIRLEVDASAETYDYYRDSILRASSQNWVNSIGTVNQIRIATDQYQGNQTPFTYDTLYVALEVDDDPEATLDSEEAYSAGTPAVETIYNQGNANMTDARLLLHMNEASGTIIDNSTGGYSGSVVGGVTYGQTGKLGDALDFNGSTGYVDMSPSLNGILGSTSTLTFWVNTTMTGTSPSWNAPGITGVEQSGGGDDIFWGWLNGSGQISITKGNTEGAISSTSINDGNWHHVALTWNSSTGQSQVYIDGDLEDTATTETGDVTTTFSSIGRIEDTGGSPEYFDGLLDELNAWNRVLTPAEIEDIYERGAFNLRIQLRSCDDAACSGETFVGPNGAGSDYYDDFDNTTFNTLPSFSITNIIDNQYVQYQVTLDSDDSTKSPELNSLTADYTGSGVAGLNFATVNLQNTYTNPVVIPFYYESNNTEPVSVRLDNVGATSFDVSLQRPDGGDPTSDTVHYFVIEEGVWTMPDGTLIEAASFASSKVSAKGNSWNNYDVVNFSHAYPSNPAVFHQVQTVNDTNWISTYISRGNSRNNPPTVANGMRIALNGSEVTTTHGSETIGWVAIQQGTGAIDGIDFEASLTSDSVRGHQNGCYNFSFSNSYASAPITLGSQLEMDGGDGGWEVGCNLSTTQIGMHNEEDTVGNGERAHTTETFAFMAFESAFDYEETVDITFQVRSCDDALCAGESYIGPDGTTGTVYTTPAGQALNVSNNRYFQYQATFTADAGNVSPELSSVTIDYTIPGAGGGGGGGGGGTGYPTSGTFLSQVHDGDTTAAEWDTVYWTETLPASTDATVAVRTGNTAVPDGSWSAWTSEFSDPTGNVVGLTGRYAQYRLTLTSSDDTMTPVVSDITVTYNP